jgi:hypothetical protein
LCGRSQVFARISGVAIRKKKFNQVSIQQERFWLKELEKGVSDAENYRITFPILNYNGVLKVLYRLNG